MEGTLTADDYQNGQLITTQLHNTFSNSHSNGTLNNSQILNQNYYQNGPEVLPNFESSNHFQPQIHQAAQQTNGIVSILVF